MKYLQGMSVCLIIITGCSDRTAIVEGTNLRDVQQDRYPLHRAARNGNVLLMEDLIGRGCDVNSGDDVGWYPLHYAVQTHNIDVAAELIRHGADLNVTHRYGATPLHIAAGDGWMDGVVFLCSRGASVDVSFGFESITPHQLAVLGGHVEVANWLAQQRRNNTPDK